MDENEIKEELTRQTLSGDRTDVELVRTKITVLKELGTLSSASDAPY